MLPEPRQISAAENAIFRRRLFRLLIRQQLQKHLPLRVTVRIRETFFEQGQVLPVDVLLISISIPIADLPDWSKKLFFGAGNARNHARKASNPWGLPNFAPCGQCAAPSGIACTRENQKRRTHGVKAHPPRLSFRSGTSPARMGVVGSRTGLSNCPTLLPLQSKTKHFHSQIARCRQKAPMARQCASISISVHSLIVRKDTIPSIASPSRQSVGI